MGQAVLLQNLGNAWNTTKSNKSFRVDVVDTGVQYIHPDLAGKMIKGYDNTAEWISGKSFLPHPYFQQFSAKNGFLPYLNKNSSMNLLSSQKTSICIFFKGCINPIATISDTSMATPHVASLAAMLAAQGRSNSNIRAVI